MTRWFPQVLAMEGGYSPDKSRSAAYLEAKEMYPELRCLFQELEDLRGMYDDATNCDIPLEVEGE